MYYYVAYILSDNTLQHTQLPGKPCGDVMAHLLKVLPDDVTPHILFVSPRYDNNINAATCAESDSHETHASQWITYGHRGGGLDTLESACVSLDPQDLTGVDGFDNKYAAIARSVPEGVEPVILCMSHTFARRV
jgi:hypothetical protein